MPNPLEYRCLGWHCQDDRRLSCALHIKPQSVPAYQYCTPDGKVDHYRPLRAVEHSAATDAPVGVLALDALYHPGDEDLAAKLQRMAGAAD